MTKLFKKKRWIALAILLVAVLIMAGLELTNTTYVLHKKKVPDTIPAKIPSKKSDTGKKSSSSKSTGSSSSTNNESDKNAAPGGGASGVLIQPFGTLVSNHFPGKNGTSTKEQSTCNTTPGAKCYIQLKNVSTGKVTRLTEQTVDGNGTAFWEWDANTLTSGTWEVTAVASLDGQTKSVTDSIKLEV